MDWCVCLCLCFPAGLRHAVHDMEIMNAQGLSAETIASQENSMNFLHLPVPLKQNMRLYLLTACSLPLLKLFSQFEIIFLFLLPLQRLSLLYYLAQISLMALCSI